jgi:hypothetical protein
MGRVANFVGDQKITKLHDFLSSNEEGVFIVIACYLGVEEGVDMWLPEDATRFDPRYSYFLTLYLYIYIYVTEFTLIPLYGCYYRFFPLWL